MGVVGHTVVRVAFDEAGPVSGLEDFLAEVQPLDVAFAVNGAMWVTDFAGALDRVASIGSWPGEPVPVSSAG